MLSDELNDMLHAAERPIVFTPGSANADAADFFQAAVQACQQLGRPGILLTKYPQQLPKNLPENVRYFGFVPLSLVLPKASAFVHHGGIGSCAQGLTAGVPQLIRPMAFDQFDNSIRLQRLGVGVELSVSEFRGPVVAEALSRLLSTPEISRQCHQLASQCDGLEAINLACDAMESLAATPNAR